MIDHFQTFLEAPTTEGFLQLQNEIQQEPDFCAVGSFVDQLAQWCEVGRYESMFEQTQQMPYSWVMSPSAHLYSAIAAEQMQQWDDAEIERFLTETMLQGLLSTGDGSLQQPFRVTYLSDCQDILAFFSADVLSRRTIRTDIGLLEVATTTENEDICFQPTSIVSLKHLENRQPIPVSKFHPRLASKRLSSITPGRSR